MTRVVLVRPPASVPSAPDGSPSRRYPVRLSTADASPCRWHGRRQCQSRRSPLSAIGFSSPSRARPTTSSVMPRRCCVTWCPRGMPPRSSIAPSRSWSTSSSANASPRLSARARRNQARDPRATSRQLCGAPCGDVMAAAARSSGPKDAAVNARSWSSTTWSPMPRAERRRSRTSSCDAARTTRTRRACSSGLTSCEKSGRGGLDSFRNELLGTSGRSASPGFTGTNPGNSCDCWIPRSTDDVEVIRSAAAGMMAAGRRHASEFSGLQELDEVVDRSLRGSGGVRHPRRARNA